MSCTMRNATLNWPGLIVAWRVIWVLLGSRRVRVRCAASGGAVPRSRRFAGSRETSGQGVVTLSSPKQANKPIVCRRRAFDSQN